LLSSCQRCASSRSSTVCAQDFSVLGSRETEPLWGAGKFIVMAISTFH
jgi:hypothetical protein